MRAQTIAQLAWYMPVSDETKSQADVVGESYTALPQDRIAQIIHYAKCHKDLEFGLHIAESFAAQEEVPFPAILHGDDLWVWRAYNFLRGNDDAVIAGVYALTLPDYATLAGQLKALLIVDGMTNKHVASKLNLPEDTVEAYEKLVFNVQDRKKDSAFIASVVFPEGRLVEAREDYVENTDYGTLLLRAGFTRGLAQVMFGIGLLGNPYDKGSTAEIAQDLDRMFLAEGLMYAHMGWANTRTHAMPIKQARASLIAGKAAGGDTGAETMAMLTPAAALAPEIATLAKLKVSARARATLPVPG